MSVTIEVQGTEKLVARFDRATTSVGQAVQRAIRTGTTAVERRTVEKLSDDVLHVRTGRLRRSIHSQFSQSGSDYQGEVGTNVEYARIHEYGGTTKPHVIEAKNGKALRFVTPGGSRVAAMFTKAGKLARSQPDGVELTFRRRVNHPGSRMPERSFLRSSLRELAPDITAGIREAVSDGLR